MLRLSVATYNIHRGFGTDGAFLPERIVEVVQALDAAVIALQEIDVHHLVDEREQLDWIAESLGMHAIPGANVLAHRGPYGNALLTRLPVLQVRRLNLAVRGFEPRGAIDVLLEFESRPIRVIATHLGLAARERTEQVGRLLHAIEEGPPGVPLIMMGDFNEWKPTGGAIRRINRRLGPALTARSFPSRFPLLPLDRIWISPKPRSHEISVYASPLARRASDHLPVRADLDWEASQLPQPSVRAELMGLN